MLSARNDSFKVRNLVDYGRAFMDTDTSVAMPALKAASQISEQIQYDNGAARSWMSIGYIKAQGGAYREAMDCYNKAIFYWKRLKLNSQVARALNTVGTLYDFLGRRDSAMIAFMQSAALLEHTEDKVSLGSTDIYIGTLHSNAGSNTKAILYHGKAVTLLRQAKDTAFLIEALTEMSDTYVAMNEPQTALPLAREALQLAHDINGNNTERSVLATAYYSTAVAHLALGQLDSATAGAKLCVSHARASGDINTYGGGALVLSDCYHQLGREAERYNVLLDFIGVSKATANVLLMQYTYDRLADAASRLNKHQQAFGFHKKFVQYKDSIFNQKNQTVLSELEVKYQTAEKEKALSQQKFSMAEKEIQLQRSLQMSFYSIASALAACFMAMLVYLYFRGKRKLHQKQFQAMEQEKEIHLLQAAMQGEEKERNRIAKDLHDGVAGMLAAVKMHFSSIALHEGGVLQTEGYQQGIHLLDEASQELRKTSHNLMPEVLLRHGVDEAVRRYCNNITNSNKLRIQYDAIGEVGRFVDSFELSVYRIVQELLNNIVKHSKATEAIVQITFQSNMLSITIEDNGIGFAIDAEQKDGTGINGLQSRVKAMNGRMELDSAPGQGLNVFLEFETAGIEKPGE